MASPYVRRDIWTLEQEQAWHPIIEAYALAIGEMQKRDRLDPTSWRYQAAVHGVPQGVPPDKWLNQCQHNSWFFLPWHRMYLYRFEQILRSIVESHPDVSDDTRQSWALPYWNYDRGDDTASLPPSFREPRFRDDEENPLFVEERAPGVNAGGRLPDLVTSPQAALAEVDFSAEAFPGTPAGFGGPVTDWHHFGELGAIPGALEATPHNDVHGTVGGDGGFMSGFATAPLDPIFWLHHANIDRLWAVWLLQEDGRENPTVARWTGLLFDFHDGNGDPVQSKPSDVIDPEADLGYTYEDVGPPAVRGRRQAMRREPSPDHPPEMVGATDERLELTGGRATVSIPLAQPSGPLRAGRESATPSRVYLNVEGIEGEKNPGLSYAVFVNVPDEDGEAEPEGTHVGNVAFFGIELASDLDRDHPEGHGLRYAFDITDVVNELREQGRWDPKRLQVTFSPLRVSLPEGARERAERDTTSVPVRIGRVSLYYH